MTETPRLSLILPCFNEMEHLDRSLSRIREYLGFTLGAGRFEIILVDDGSSDGTRDYLSKLAASAGAADLKVLLNPRNFGRGGAVKRGLELARGEISGFIDIDLEISEVYLPRFVELIESGADLAVATRTYRIRFSLSSVLRHLLSSGYSALTRRWLRVPVSDSEAGYKFFSSRMRTAILARSRFDNWFFDTEVPLLCEKAEFRIVELPVLFLRNARKTSTVRPFRDTWQYLESIRRYRRIREQNGRDTHD